jgi:hypothetical protein
VQALVEHAIGSLQPGDLLRIGDERHLASEVDAEDGAAGAVGVAGVGDVEVAELVGADVVEEDRRSRECPGVGEDRGLAILVDPPDAGLSAVNRFSLKATRPLGSSRPEAKVTAFPLSRTATEPSPSLSPPMTLT